MARVFMAAIIGICASACATTPQQIAEAEILATWEQFEIYYNSGDVEGVKSLLYIDGLEEEAQEQVEAETMAMAAANAAASNWMMSPNVGMKIDADVNVQSIDGDNAVLDGTLTQVTGQSVYFAMNLARIDGQWLLAPGGAVADRSDEEDSAPTAEANL